MRDLRAGMVKYVLNVTSGKSDMRLFVTSTSERSPMTHWAGVALEGGAALLGACAAEAGAPVRS